jgi:ABC-type multidrug transport system permease subunit
MNLIGSSMWGIGYAVVDSRKRKLLKRLAATPMVRWHYMASLFLSRLAFLALEIVVLIAFGVLAFSVPIRGSLLALAAVVMAGALGSAGLALFIAARPRSAEVATGLMNAAMLPMWLLSGSFFSYQRFPEWLHPAIKLLPLTAINDAMRAIVNDGASLAATAPMLLVLGAWALAGFVFAARYFRWQ